MHDSRLCRPFHSKCHAPEDPTSLAASTGSAFLNLVFTPDNRTSLRTIGWLQQNAHPFDRRIAYGQRDATQRDRAAHAQMAFERGGPGERTWKAFAGITLRHSWIFSHSCTGSGNEAQLRGDDTISRTRWARKVESGNLPPL